MDAASGWCRGCARSLDEIAGWGQRSAEQQWQVLDQLPRRLDQLRQAGLLLQTRSPRT
jgi:hypothetical protein